MFVASKAVFGCLRVSSSTVTMLSISIIYYRDQDYRLTEMLYLFFIMFCVVFVPVFAWLCVSSQAQARWNLTNVYFLYSWTLGLVFDFLFAGGFHSSYCFRNCQVKPVIGVLYSSWIVILFIFYFQCKLWFLVSFLYFKCACFLLKHKKIRNKFSPWDSWRRI